MFLAVIVGWNVGRLFLRRAFQNWMVAFPIAFVVGTLLLTWFTYLLAYFFRGFSNPLGIANTIAMPIFFVLAVWFHIRNKRKKTPALDWNKTELIFTGIAFIFSAFLMFYSFYVVNDVMFLGRTVFSDFCSHLPLIRSFSRGANFPTQFALFPDGDMRYHFMFQFLVGNLEYLGMRIDWAFNIPSILGLTGALMALYALAVAITGKKAVGILTAAFFAFRSSFAFFTFASGIKGVGQIFTNATFIGDTRNEVWGLWNQNVYANQRHLAFGLILLFVVIIELLPLLKDKVSQAWIGKDAWAIHDWWRCVGLGLTIGALAYWNGAVVLVILMMLAFMAVFSKNKMEFAVIASLAYLLTILQSSFFVPSGESLVKFSTYFGFIADEASFMGVAKYYIELLGVLPILAIVSFFTVRGLDKKWLIITFLVPIVFATTVSLTPDIVVNHKYVMMSAMLLNIFAAYLIWLIYNRRHAALKIVAVLLAVLMLITGVVDLITFVNGNRQNHIVVNDKSPEIVWIMENTQPRDVILMKEHTLDGLVNAGRPIFHGWPYFAWSAGYNTDERDRLVAEIYGATDIRVLRHLLNEYNIAYVVIDNEVRGSKNYVLNEEIFRDNFELAARFDNLNRDIFRVGL